MNTSLAAGSNSIVEIVDAPIFLTGFARSGTTWVNRLLRDYFSVGLVNEGQFIVAFGWRLARYGDLRQGENFRRLLRELRDDEFFWILKRNYGVDIDWHHAAGRPPSFPAIVLDVLRQIADKLDKQRIGSKYPVFGRYLGLLDELFPNCRVVHVVRDGRDCALSHKHMTWGHQNTYAAAVHWRDYLRKARSAAQRMGGRYLEVRYEDLLAEPESTVGVLEKFLTGTSGPITERFMEDSHRLKPEKIAHWRDAMPVRDQAIFEGVAGDALRDAGYPITGTGHRPTVVARALYTLHDRVAREAWHWARRFFPAIPERKG
ncbi:MAG TPA: sulfotransferase [Rhodanobacteraceae bacterium]|jgi:hypothetical protein|nr:sulfotransferase [Rhodanobacteraceae bacterium]